MPDWVRKIWDSAMLLAVVTAIFAAGGLMQRVRDIEQRLNQIETHLDSVDAFAHGRHK